MKKFLSVLTVFLFLTSPIFAAKYTLCCGKTITSINQEGCETAEEWFEIIRELNEINCGISVEDQEHISVDENIGDNWYHVNC